MLLDRNSLRHCWRGASAERNSVDGGGLDSGTDEEERFKNSRKSMTRASQQLGKGSIALLIRLILIAIFCTALLMPIAAVSTKIVSSQPLLIAISFGLAYIVAPAVLLQLWPARRVTKWKSMGDALWDGELLTVDYPVSAVAQIEEMEDEGFHFLVAIDNVGTLWLSGQYLYGPVERGEFPSQCIRLFRNKVTGALYGIEATGRRLEHWVTYDPVRGEPTEAGFDLEDSKVYSQSIEQIATALNLRRKSISETGVANQS
jgi:hypothetical protein